MVFEADKIVITKNGDFVGKSYLSGGLFVLNIVSEPMMNKIDASSAYSVESVNLWHGRLGHVNSASILKLKTLGLISVDDSDSFPKCPSCVEAKFVKKPFKSITSRNSELLELVHTDLADFKNTVSKGGKRYYISFVDDCSRYTKIYLLKNKDEAEQMFLNL